MEISCDGVFMKKMSEYAFPLGGLRCYYYTASVDNALDIIEKSHLYGSFPSKVNDPDDLRIEIMGLDRSPLLSANANVQENVNRQLVKKTIMDRVYRFVCLADADKVDIDSSSALRFWNEYAGGFKGVRFEFTVDKNFVLTPTSQECLCENISYTGEKAILDLSNVKNVEDIEKEVQKEDFLRSLCYSKAEKWSAEYEFRIGSVYRRLKNEMSLISSREERFFEFDKSSIKSVTVGCLAEEADIMKLKMFSTKHSLNLLLAEVDLKTRTI